MLATAPDEELVRRLLGRPVEFVQLPDLLELLPEELAAGGLGPDEIERVGVVAEIARRYQPATTGDMRITTPRSAVALFPRLRATSRPAAELLLLNRGFELVTRMASRESDATANEERTKPQDVENAAYVILAHNHHNVSSPTRRDVYTSHLACRLATRAALELLDHIVVARRGWTSLRDIRCLYPD